ncbi:MAG: arabinogalactan transporter permease [Clostridia bacterium]|jgi:multiple sugar transport system permease protein|nr:arabinogalactan transporter permease [Clostridia bacterium]
MFREGNAMTEKQKRLIGKILTYLVLTIAFIIVIFPVAYTLLGSFKSNQELLTGSSGIIPSKFVWDNYVQAWNLANFERYTFNSVFMTFFIVIGTIITCTTAAYVFERGEFKFKNALFIMVVSSMFVSLGSLTLYPTLMIAKVFGINRSLWGVIIIRVLGLNVTNLVIARSYIKTIPREIDEAAKIDGYGFFQIFIHIIFPLLKPLIATLGILEFRSAWNDYLMPMVFTLSNPKRMPLVVGVVNLKSTGEAASSWNLMLAGTAISIIPMILVYVCLNRYFIDSLTAGSVKG